MATYQLAFITRNRDHRKVRIFNFKRLKLSVFLMVFSLSFGLSQSIANAANDSPNSNIDLLDCKYDEQVRLFLDPLFCIKRGYKEITKKKRAKIISDRLANFAKSGVDLEYLEVKSYPNCPQDLSQEDYSIQKCSETKFSVTKFSVTYKNSEEEDPQENTITTFESKDLCLWLLQNKCKEDLDNKLKSQEKAIIDLENKIFNSIKTSVENFREPQCQLTSQAVNIELNQLKGTLFCIQTSIRDNENISERAERIQKRITDIQEGEINLETLEIVKVSDLKEKFGISEFDKLIDNTQEEKSNQKLVNNQSLAIVSHQKDLSQEERIILILTPLDLELINNQNNLTVFQTINNYLQKIIIIVKSSDQAKKPVSFDWNPYNNLLFHRLDCLKEKIEEEKKPIECQKNLFKVDDKGKYFNPSYRAVTIKNKISALTNKPWRIFLNPNLGVYHKQKDTKNNTVEYFKLCMAIIIRSSIKT